MKKVLVLIMIVGVVFGATAQKDNSKLKKIGGEEEISLISLSSLSSLSELSQLSDLSSLAALSQLGELSELSSLASLADQANLVILPSLTMDITEDMSTILIDLQDLHDIEIDLSTIEELDLTELNEMIKKTLGKALKDKEQ